MSNTKTDGFVYLVFDEDAIVQVFLEKEIAYQFANIGDFTVIPKKISHSLPRRSFAI